MYKIKIIFEFKTAPKNIKEIKIQKWALNFKIHRKYHIMVFIFVNFVQNLRGSTEIRNTEQIP